MVGMLGAAVDEALELDASVLSDVELSAALLELRRQQSRLEAATARVAGCWDARKIWKNQRFRSGASWLAVHGHTSKASAGEVLRMARFVRGLAEVAEAWESGDIHTDHVKVLRHAHNARTAECLRRDQKVLIDAATTTTRFESFENAVRYWLQLADPDGTDQETEEQLARNRASCVQADDGVWLGRFQLDTIGGAIFNTTLREIYEELFRAEWAAGKRIHGDQMSVSKLLRTPEQRLAAAMVEMARRAKIAPKDGKQPRPLFVIFSSWEQFHGPLCEFVNGSVVNPSAMKPYMADADIERLVFDGPTRVIQLSKRKRLFTGGLRRAILLRDRRCFGDQGTCDSTPTDVDHIETYESGGETTQQNGRAACSWHNHNRPQAADNPWPPPDDYDDDEEDDDEDEDEQ